MRTSESHFGPDEKVCPTAITRARQSPSFPALKRCAFGDPVDNATGGFPSLPPFHSFPSLTFLGEKGVGQWGESRRRRTLILSHLDANSSDRSNNRVTCLLAPLLALSSVLSGTNYDFVLFSPFTVQQFFYQSCLNSQLRRETRIIVSSSGYPYYALFCHSR